LLNQRVNNYYMISHGSVKSEDKCIIYKNLSYLDSATISHDNDQPNNVFIMHPMHQCKILSCITRIMSH